MVVLAFWVTGDRWLLCWRSDFRLSALSTKSNLYGIESRQRNPKTSESRLANPKTIIAQRVTKTTGRCDSIRASVRPRFYLGLLNPRILGVWNNPWNIIHVSKRGQYPPKKGIYRGDVIGISCNGGEFIILQGVETSYWG